MLNTTVSRLKCPKVNKDLSPCIGTLKITNHSDPSAKQSNVFEITHGSLKCVRCSSEFPILAGVAILVSAVREYLQAHAKGISKVVSDSEIPKKFLKSYLEAKAEALEAESEHIEEDLEAKRVTALYVMNHYLSIDAKLQDSGSTWWKSQSGTGSPVFENLIRQYWDQGPFAQIRNWIHEEQTQSRTRPDCVELGCGVGGLYLQLRPFIRSYLGIDSSFLSVALGRHLALGVPFSDTLLFPEDLLQGSVSRKIPIPAPKPFDGSADLVVGDLNSPPIHPLQWDCSIALNAIDMLDEPASLPELQFNLLKKGGIAIQSCPYIWHPEVARQLRESLPAALKDTSSKAVEWLYKQAGFNIEKTVSDIPWLFFKHIRQMEIYSVHAFVGRKNSEE